MADQSQPAQRRLKVFLCHASEDKPAVRELYERLKDYNVDCWLDEKKILPGQNWNSEIQKAMRSSDIVIVCLTRKFTEKEGYGQTEVNLALSIALEKHNESIFLIP